MRIIRSVKDTKSLQNNEELAIKTREEREQHERVCKQDESVEETESAVGSGSESQPATSEPTTEEKADKEKATVKKARKKKNKATV